MQGLLPTRVASFLLGLSLLVVSGAANAREVLLTSRDVRTAGDIERAIIEATNSGTERGLVVLNGSEGDFVYDPLRDRSINVFLSNFELRGVADATIANCADGLFFAGSTAVRDVLIRGITFRCVDGLGVRGGGPAARENIVLRENVFDVERSGVWIGQAVDWTVAGNTIMTRDGFGVRFAEGSTGSNIIGNTLVAPLGISLINGATATLAVDNVIVGMNLGIVLDSGASRNELLENQVHVPVFPGIVLGATTFENEVRGNTLFGAGDREPIVDRGTGNEVFGNHVVLKGDLDRDGDVDLDDLRLLLPRRNEPALEPIDPADLDGDGWITGLDARQLVLLCTRNRCASD